jgi:two-component system phosphate regulon response regulator PhoB
MNTSPVRILCVDDNQDSSDLLSLMLYTSNNTYQVTTVSTAEEASSVMEQQAFDLYILDWWLPEMSGLELCQKIREKDKQTPIMFFTGMANSSYYAEGIQAGANEYLVKPNDLEHLTKTVKRLLNKTKLFSRRRDIARRKVNSIV